MLTKHYFKTQILLAALAAAVIAPICAFSQQKPAARTIKDSDIYVPDRFLEPSYTRKEAMEILRDCVATFGDTDMPRTYEAYVKDPDKFEKPIGEYQVKSAMVSLKSCVKEPEIQEAIGATAGWYDELIKKAEALNEPAALLDKAIRLRNSAMYTQATKAYAAKFSELEKFAKKPDRMDAAKLKKLVEDNKARRKAEYIALRKKQILEEEAAAQEDLQEELKKTSASKKK